MAQEYVVGIDIGGQTTKIGVVDRDGNILDRCVIRSDGHTHYSTFIASLAEAVNGLIASTGTTGKIKGVGIGAPNANYYKGTIEYAVNLDWGKCVIPFAKELSALLSGLPVTLTNDANAAALGEKKYGVAKDIQHFIMITLGTGVGSGIIINGELLYGNNGFAGELGHVCAVPGGRQCGCGKKGCLEAYCSAIGVARTAKEWLESGNEASVLRDKEDISSKDVYDAAKAGDAFAIKVFNYTSEILGRCLADFCCFSEPEAIVLFGGLARSREFLEKPIVDAMEANMLPPWRGKVKLLFSSLKESDAAILGASALAW